MAQKKVGFSNTSYIQGDKLIVNNGTTASINFTFAGPNGLTFSLPTSDGSAGYSLITDGNGNLSFGTVSNQGNVQAPTGGGTNPYLTYWTGSYSLGDTGAQYSPGQILFPGGSSPAPGVSFILDSDTGMYRVADNQVGFAGGGSLLGKFSSSGVTVGSVTYTNVDGTAGYALVTDGAGNTYWAFNGGVTGPTGPQGDTGATGPQGATGGVENQFMYQSGTISGASFSGTPSYYDVTFVGSFTSSYVVSVDSSATRDWTIYNKTATGFRLSSESTSAFTETVYWNALEVSSLTLGAFVGAQGPAGVDGATGATGQNGTEFVPSASTGTVIAFTSSLIYNSPASPATASITDDLTSANIGIIQKIYHQYTSEPTYPAGWVNLGLVPYDTSNLNIIFAEWVSGTRVEYWIVN